MDTFQETLLTTGIGGLISGLSQCDDNYIAQAIQDASRIVPETILKTSERDWNILTIKLGIMLSSERDDEEFILLGNDLSLLEALASIGHNRTIKILTSSKTPIKLVENMKKNTPKGLKICILPSGFIPIIEHRATIVVTAFEAGGGYFLIEEESAVALGAIRGQQFTGSIIALLPLDESAIHERPSNWKMVRHDRFSGLCRPNGFESITPNI